MLNLLHIEFLIAPVPIVPLLCFLACVHALASDRKSYYSCYLLSSIIQSSQCQRIVRLSPIRPPAISVSLHMMFEAFGFMRLRTADTHLSYLRALLA